MLRKAFGILVVVVFFAGVLILGIEMGGAEKSEPLSKSLTSTPKCQYLGYAETTLTEAPPFFIKVKTHETQCGITRNYENFKGPKALCTAWIQCENDPAFGDEPKLHACSPVKSLETTALCPSAEACAADTGFKVVTERSATGPERIRVYEKTFVGTKREGLCITAISTSPQMMQLGSSALVDDKCPSFETITKDTCVVPEVASVSLEPQRTQGRTATTTPTKAPKAL